jgi:cytochrome P450
MNVTTTAQRKFQIKGPTPINPLAAIRALNADPIAAAASWFHEYGDFVALRFGPFQGYQISHPELIKHVLQDNFRNYGRFEPSNSKFKLISGLNLFTSDGDYWLRQRRLLQPSFHRQRLAALVDLMMPATQEMLDRWSLLSVVDMEAEMMQVTLLNVSRALFSLGLGGAAIKFHNAFTTANEYVGYLLTTPVVPPRWLPTRRNRQFKQAMQILDEVVNQIISSRKESTNRPDDMLTMLLDARYEDTGEHLTDKQLRDEVMALLIAGHETTANSLTWALHLLATHPEIQQQVREEIQLVLADRTVTVADIGNLVFTAAVIDETLRLYPTAFTLTRQAHAEDLLGGNSIRAGSVILISTWNTHRHPEFWNNPEQFDPGRFVGEHPERPRFAYMPFGGGPRQCIGMHLALMEMRLVLAMILQRYEVSPLEGAPAVRIHALTSLRTRQGLHLALTRVANGS